MCACGVVCGCVVLACCREHVVVLVVRVCVCGVCGVLFFCVCTCGVGCWCSVCVHVVLVKLGTRKTPFVYVQNASVCRTSPCVPATGPHVQDMRACCRYTRRRPDRTHGGFLFSLSVALSRSFFPLLFSRLVSLLTCLFLFFSSFFSFLFSPLSSLSSSLSAHTETTSDRQVTLPTKNGHAPRDPLNQERAINLSILAMSHPGKYSRVESN